MSGAHDTYELVGHDDAEKLVLSAIRSGRLPHAWLIAGPKGIGKATLAYRFARFLLVDGATPDLLGNYPDSLFVDPDHPVSKRVAADSHGDLMVVERTPDPKKSNSDVLRTRVVVDQVRAVGRFFSQTSSEGGWRITIVDGAEEMNANAANALLKILEEPPSQSLLLLVSHAPGRLLPTIRSRCRMLQCRPLSDMDVSTVLSHQLPDLSEAENMALARLSEGSPGRAVALSNAGGLDAYCELIALLSNLPKVDYVKVHALADRFQRREGQEAFTIWMDLFRLWLMRMVRGAASGESNAEAVAGESELQARLVGAGSLDKWIDLWDTTNELTAKAFTVNLDRKQVVLSTFFELERTAQGA